MSNNTRTNFFRDTEKESIQERDKFLAHSIKKLINLESEKGSDKKINAQAEIIKSLKDDKKNEQFKKKSAEKKPKDERTIENKTLSKTADKDDSSKNNIDLLKNFKEISEVKQKKTVKQTNDDSRNNLVEQSEKILLYSYVLSESDLESLEKLIGRLPQYLKDKLKQLENEEYAKRELGEYANEEMQNEKQRQNNSHDMDNERNFLESLNPLDVSVNLFDTVIHAENEKLHEELGKFAEENGLHKECAGIIKGCLKDIESDETSSKVSDKKYHPELENKIQSFAKGLNRDPKLEPIVKLLTMKIASMPPEERKQLCENLASKQKELEKKSLERETHQKSNSKNQNTLRGVSF